jgi:exoribonuclease-2
MHKKKEYTRLDLSRIATIVMKEHGLEPDFSQDVHDQLKLLNKPGVDHDSHVQDLTELLWCSLDNDDSQDLDQLTACTDIGNGNYKVFIAIADVDALIKKNSPIDQHAMLNTASVYTSARIFPMLPEKLSTNLTSLNLNETRLALVTEIIVGQYGEIFGSTIYRATVLNRAKLAYDSVSGWIESTESTLPGITNVPGMAKQIRMQDTVAQQLRKKRYLAGSLHLQIFQPKAIFEGEHIVGIKEQVQNRGRQLIEELMIATNESTAHFLLKKGIPSLRRVVRSPERWLRIVELAKQYGEILPNEANSKALSAFLAKQNRRDPIRFPDLSLVVVKLMGPGEYVVEQPGATPVGHFGLAVQDYMHSTAPNRRYPDLITLRMIKQALNNSPSPYNQQELYSLAIHCTSQEDAIRKVERRVRKSEAALFLEPYIGKDFDGIITGVTPNYGWVRIFNPPAEGMLIKLPRDCSIGNKLRVKLISTDVDLGHINFTLA